MVEVMVVVIVEVMVAIIVEMMVEMKRLELTTDVVVVVEMVKRFIMEGHKQ